MGGQRRNASCNWQDICVGKHYRSGTSWGIVTRGHATQALHSRLDPGGRVLAAQDFHHTVQGETELVADYIRRLERTFWIAYGRDSMSAETCDTLLHSQPQEWLQYDLMRGPAISGVQTYKELRLGAKNEEKRLAELKKQQPYQKPVPLSMQHPNRKTAEYRGGDRTAQRHTPRQKTPPISKARQCYICNKPGHLACECGLTRQKAKDDHL